MSNPPKSASRVLLFPATVAAVVLGTGMVMTACNGQTSPTVPAPVTAPADGGHAAMAGTPAGHNAAADEKGYIDGWFQGQQVHLYYTKWFYCAEPPPSGAPTNCEIGAAPETPPRPGPIPTIYAIAAVGGIQPNPLTLACRAGTPCLNHPAMIDVSRVRGPGFESAPALPHSHILDERRAGWFNTINIRVSDLAVWNDIAAAKSLERVRQLQADPEVGGRGRISQDTPTNIYFFIASWRATGSE